MHTSDDLFLLIKSLSKAEKRYFKLHSTFQKGDKDYLVLFDALDVLTSYEGDDRGNPKYDESALKKKVGKKISTTQLHVTKSYLYDQIMRSLRQQYETSNTDALLKALISNITILNQKGLYYQMFKILATAKNIALKFEKFHVLIELLNIEIKYCARHEMQGIEVKLSDLYSQIFRYHELYENELIYRKLRNEAMALYRKNARARNGHDKVILSKLIDEPILQDGSFAQSFLAKISYHYTKAILKQAMADSRGALENYQNLQSVWVGYPHFKEEYPIDYIIYTSNYLVGCHLIRDYTPFPALLCEMEKLSLHSFDEKAEAFQNIAYVRQLYFMNHEIFDLKGQVHARVMELLVEIEEGLKEYEPRIAMARLLAIYNNTAVLFFAVADFNNALKWLSKIQQVARTDQRKDLQLFARLLQLIIFMETDEHIYIDNAFKAFEYHLRKEDKRHEFEGRVTYFLKQLSAMKQNKKIILEKFKEAIATFENQKIPGHEEISIWVESKVQNCPFLEVLRKKVGHQDSFGKI